MMRVESVFLNNLNAEMMQAYLDGDIIHEIKYAIINSEDANQQFTTLCSDGNGEELFSAAERKDLLEYIMTRYANMRGRYFVKYLRGTVSGSAADAVVESQATRTKVINASVKSKRSNDQEECEMWKAAEESVVDAADVAITNCYCCYSSYRYYPAML